MLLDGEDHFGISLDHLNYFHVSQVVHCIAINFKYLVSSLQSSFFRRPTLKSEISMQNRKQGSLASPGRTLCT